LSELAEASTGTRES